MNKKKILVLAMTLSMVAILAIGGTIAYFTDVDSENNVFTVGNLDIVLHEEQRNDEGTALEPFDQDKKLYPIVGSAQGEKDELFLPVAENYVDKVVTVENKGTEDAWVRAYFAIPSALDDGHDTYNAGLNTLHFNFGYTSADHSTIDKEWEWQNDAGNWKYFETAIGNINYNVYFADYYQPLAAGATTERLLNGVYLDSSFDYVPATETEADYYTAFGKKLELDAAWDWNNVQCPVYIVAVQEAGFDSVKAAVDGAFGAQYNPWGGDVTNWFE